MASSRHPVMQMAVELVIKLVKKYPWNATTVVVTAGASLLVGAWLDWTLATAFVLTCLSVPVKRWIVEPELWIYRYRRLLAGESMRYPGRREAMRFRSREQKRMRETRKQFAAACEANGLMNAAKQTPTLRHLKSLADGSLTAVIHPGKMAIKGGVPAFQKLRDEIAATCGVDGGIRIKPFGVGAGNSVAPSSAKLTFFFDVRTWEALPIQQLAPAPVGKVSVGNDEDRNPANMPLVLSLLLVAMTGKGKSKAIWTLLVGIAAKGVRHRLFVVDPKRGQELGPLARVLGLGWIGNRLLEAYGKNSEADAYRVIMAADKACTEQQDALAARGINPWTEAHAEEFPMIVLVMDEVLTFLSKITAANKEGKAAEAALIHMLSEGRAAGCKVIMASQASDKEILGTNRTLIPGRIVLGTENPTQTGMAFGDLTAEAVGGAVCSQLDEPGLAYMKIEGQRGYKLVRIALVDDQDIEDYVETGLPANMGANDSGRAQEEWRPQWIYRYFVKANCIIDGVFYFAGQLAYVGVTNSPKLRHEQHVAAYQNGDPKYWWMAYVDTDARPLLTYAGEDRAVAEAEETREIQQYCPLGNLKDNQGNPWLGQGPVGMPVEQVHQSWLQRHTKRISLPKLTAPEPEPEAPKTIAGPAPLRLYPTPKRLEEAGKR